jgi:hypothetical protein
MSPRSISMVEIGAQGLDRRLEPLHFLGIFGDVIGDDDARLVQHDMAEADAIGDRAGPCSAWPAHGDVGAGRASDCSSPEAIISASTIAVVCSASTSSSE